MTHKESSSPATRETSGEKSREKSRDKTRIITRANLEAWDEVAPIHADHNHAQQLADMADPGHSALDEIERARLAALEVAGKDVAQICCNNGRELIYVKRLGAARCVGFDGSAAFIQQARELAAAAQADCDYVCTDVYDIDPQYHAAFDLLTITIGVLSWMPDLPGFFRAITPLLRPGGALFIYEQHPIVEMVTPGGPDDAVEWELSYFNTEPYVEYGLDYYGEQEYEAKPATSFQHKMSDIIMAGIHTGLSVEQFEELPGHISNTWYNVEKQGPGLPMSYTLTFRKPQK
ncbi:class I SAM-dependent methyltransferase [Rhodovibrionaceae bacterium A322]